MFFRLEEVVLASSATPVDDGFFDEPYPAYRAARDLAGPARQPDGSVFAGRYDDVAEILSHDHDYSSDKTIDFKPRFGDGPLYEHHTTSLVFNDPPYHTRVRRLLTPFFTPRTLRALEPNVATMIDGLVDAVTRLVADQELRIRLGDEGCHRWTETFRYQEMARLVREVYEEVLAG